MGLKVDKWLLVGTSPASMMEGTAEKSAWTGGVRQRLQWPLVVSRASVDRCRVQGLGELGPALRSPRPGMAGAEYRGGQACSLGLPGLLCDSRWGHTKIEAEAGEVGSCVVMQNCMR